jgi:hypothetical protein
MMGNIQKCGSAFVYGLILGPFFKNPDMFWRPDGTTYCLNMAISKENENLQDLVTLAQFFHKNHKHDLHWIFFCH